MLGVEQNETTPKPPAILTAAQILSAKRRQTKLVPCPEWGGDVLIQKVSLKVRDEISDAITSHKGKGLLHFATNKMIAACVVNAQGEPAFTAEQIAELADVDAAVIDRVYRECWEFNGFDRNRVGDAEKN